MGKQEAEKFPIAEESPLTKSTLDVGNGKMYEDESSHAFSVGSVELQSVQSKMQKEELERQKANLARRESKAVRILRLLVLGSLVATATLVAVGTYLYATSDEKEEFKAGFESHAQKVIESFHDAVEQRLGAIGMLSDSITSYAHDVNAQFPFVTVSDFAVRGANLRIRAGSLIVHWAPIVTDDNRDEWEEYALENRFQINEAYDQDFVLRGEQDEFFGLDDMMEDEQEGSRRERSLQEGEGHERTLPEEAGDPAQQEQRRRAIEFDILGAPEPVVENNVVQDGTGYHKRIYKVGNHTAELDGTGPYLPLWQRSPVTKSRQINLNLNFATTPVFKGVLPQIMNDPKAIINKFVLPLKFGQKQITANLKIGQWRHDLEDYKEDPISFMAYPVFDSFTKGKKLVGVLVSNLYWRLYFTGILGGEKAQGIIAVLENSYNQTFAYRIDGPEVAFLGPGDPHDVKYNDMEVWEDVTSEVSRRAGPGSRAYTTVPLSETYGRYTLHVYPSQTTEDQYKSNKPAIYTSVVALTCVLSAIIFLLFDRWVERRQKVVLDRAAQSGVLVANLFPEKVQDRLYDEVKPVDKISVGNGASSLWIPGGSSSAMRIDDDDDSEAEAKSDQIADAYDSVTLMFADLAGFTKWSSTRTPSDVFNLLESLYSAFDAIALKRKVFKVETIGDCYFAVCGLPEPNEDHAVVMAKFSRDCMAKMNDIVVKMSASLGNDTCELRFRVGLHSGSVTAGILRGQRARYQLFGDTVNTASRMESNGSPGRIHVSEATAKELRAKGKHSWLVPREDKIVAKGKGEMQTYWVSIRANTKTASTNGASSDQDSLIGILDDGVDEEE